MTKKIISQSLWLVWLLFFLVTQSCTKQSAHVPLGITSITPDNGAAGTAVTISGSGFNIQATANTVKFNGKAAVVKTASASQLIIEVPAGATTGNVTVEANGQLATGPVFTFKTLACRISLAKTTYSQSSEVTACQFLYDADGRLTEMVYGNGTSGGKRIITYPTGRPYVLTVVPLPDGTWIQRMEVSLYENGLLREVSAVYNFPNSPVSTSSYTKFSVTNTLATATKTETSTNLFSWDLAGDMIRYAYEKDNSDISKGTNYTYYSDKEYAPKNVDLFTRNLSTFDGYDYIRFYGAPAYSTVHLVKTQKAGPSISNYVYEFDADDKVTKITITSDTGAVSKIEYTYDCK